NTSTLPAVTFTYAAKQIHYVNDSPDPQLILDRPYLTDTANGYGATTHFDYTQLPTLVPVKQWSRQNVTARSANSSNSESVTFAYPSPAAYLLKWVGSGWDYVHASYRGFPTVVETDLYRKITHSYYTTYPGSGQAAFNPGYDPNSEIRTGREISAVTADLY